MLINCVEKYLFPRTSSFSSKSLASFKMGHCLSRQKPRANIVTDWQALFFDGEAYSILVCRYWCSLADRKILSETCRAGWRIGRSVLLVTLLAERSRRRLLEQDVRCLVGHFNRASDIFEQDDDDGVGLLVFEFRTLSEKSAFYHDVTDFQRRCSDL